MVNFMLKVCMKYQYVRIVSSGYAVRSRSCIIYRAAVCTYSGEKTASTVMVNKRRSNSSNSNNNNNNNGKGVLGSR